METDEEMTSIIIEGIQTDNRKFRPSDWIERIASNWATFGADHRLRYSPAVYPCIIDGEKCLVVAKDLREKNPEGFESVLQFARANKLRTHEDRRDTPKSAAAEEDRRNGGWNYSFFGDKKSPQEQSNQ